MRSEETKLREYRDQVNEVLATVLPRQSRLEAVHAARAGLLSPGKRVRPLLAVLVAEHLGCSADRILPAACAVEMIHAASLILDDLPCMDDAQTRRGEPSLHRLYGEDIALLAVITLVSEAYAVLAAVPDADEALRLRWVGILARAVGPLGLVGGQERDLHGETDRSLEDIRALHLRKTAVLFSAAAEMGAAAAGADEATLTAARRFGEALGLALQAFDDMADAADAAELSRGANLLSRMDQDGAKAEARNRLSEAGLALEAADQRLVQVAPYIDLLLSRMVATA